jgi:hypothetical protein
MHGLADTALRDPQALELDTAAQELVGPSPPRFAPATSALEFVSGQIEKFGICGSNNAAPDDLRREALPAPSHQFTKENHFRFGFNGVAFNSRTSRSALYWAEFGKTSRPHRGFLAEVRQALSEIHETYGRLSVSNSGNPINRGLVAAAKELGLEIEQVSIQLDGHPPPAPDEALPHRLHEKTWGDFSEFARQFGQAAGCSSPWMAFEAYHGALSDCTHLYTFNTTAVVDHNFDMTRGERVGPPNWAFVNREAMTAINRWLLASGKSGIPQFLFWSPELLAAQVDSEVARELLREASGPPPESMAQAEWWQSLTLRFNLFQAAYPDVSMEANTGQARKDQELNRNMLVLRKGMRRANPGCNTAHFVPLYRLMRELGIKVDVPVDEPERLFGSVDRGM